MITSTHNESRSECPSSVLSSYLYEVRYIILFYILGDVITTYTALSCGAYEKNPFLLSFELTILLKIIYVAILFVAYQYLKNWPRSWSICKYSVFSLGLLATISNTMVFVYGYSIFQLAGVA